MREKKKSKPNSKPRTRLKRGLLPNPEQYPVVTARIMLRVTNYRKQFLCRCLVCGKVDMVTYSKYRLRDGMIRARQKVCLSTGRLITTYEVGPDIWAEVSRKI